MDAALVGLAGVVVGALIGLFGPLLGQQRIERREDRQRLIQAIADFDSNVWIMIQELDAARPIVGPARGAVDDVIRDPMRKTLAALTVIQVLGDAQQAQVASQATLATHRAITAGHHGNDLEWADRRGELGDRTHELRNAARAIGGLEAIRRLPADG